MVLEQRLLGETGISVGRIGISSSYGAGPEVYEAALDHGCNYFTWGTFIKGRSSAFISFMRNIIAAKRREEIILGLLSYSHTVTLGDLFLKSALKRLGTDYIDCLILGYYSSRPPDRILEWTQRLKERGIIRAVGITTHNRSIVAPLSQEQLLDFFHIRYNAVHRGAERDIFPLLPHSRPGLVTFTATCWGKLMNQKKLSAEMKALSAGDCYRFVLERDEVDVCMMGVRDLAMLEDNLKIIEKGPMSFDEIEGVTAVGDYLYGKKRPA